MLILGSPVEDKGKRWQELFPNLGNDQNHQMVSSKNSVQGLNLNLSRNYSQGILCRQSKWFWWSTKAETSEWEANLGNHKEF